MNQSQGAFRALTTLEFYFVIVDDKGNHFEVTPGVVSVIFLVNVAFIFVLYKKCPFPVRLGD